VSSQCIKQVLIATVNSTWFACGFTRVQVYFVAIQSFDEELVTQGPVRSGVLWGHTLHCGHTAEERSFSTEPYLSIEICQSTISV